MIFLTIKMRDAVIIIYEIWTSPGITHFQLFVSYLFRNHIKDYIT